MIETPSPLESLAAYAIAYLAGILFTLALTQYIDTVLAEEHERQAVSPPPPGPHLSPLPSES